MTEASRNVRESKTSIPLAFPHAGAKLQLVLTLVMITGITISASAQRTVDTRDPKVRLVAHATISPSSSGDSSQGEYADLKLSNSVRQLAHLAGLPPKTIFHLCWDFNFLLMLALIFWKGGPPLSAALQARSRSVRRAIEEAQRFAEEAAIRLAEVEKRWAQLDSEIAAIRALAEAQTNYEEQVLNATTTADIRRIMEYSQSEIERATQLARHELKAFAANLGIHIARQSIKIDEKTDQGLLKGFIKGLGDQEFAQTTEEPPMQSDRELV